MTTHRFFFVHMMKTAGTTLRHRLVHHFGERGVYPTRGVDGRDPVALNISTDHLLDRLAARGDEIRVITGHFPLCTTELVGGRFTTLTLLREPVDRTLSYLRHTRETDPAHRESTLEEIYGDRDRFHSAVHNHMTKMLALTSDEMTFYALTRVAFTRDHLERAKAALAGMAAVGLQEHFEDFCGELARRFGWRLGEPRTLNASAEAEVDDRLRRRIAEDNALDTELYDFAKQLVAARAASGASSR